jgi:ligand-binding sensor domain-containing protein
MIAALAAALYTSTAHVRALAVSGNVLWAATAGGVEQYDLIRGARVRLFTTADGLDSNDTLDVRHDGALHIRTRLSTCSQIGDTVPNPSGGQMPDGIPDFRCVPEPPPGPPEATVAELLQGTRVTQRMQADGREIVATDGAGLWLDGVRITPAGQLCGNHVSALASFQGAIWVGTFDSGVCVLEGGRFRPVAAPFRMVNDLRVTPGGLFIAAAEGLFFTRDGRRFRGEGRVRERGVNRLAASRRWLFVTTPVALYALRLQGRTVVRRWHRPAGSTALQGVALSGGDVWLASEDAGVIRMRRGRFHPFDRASGLPSSWVVDVAPAPDGGVWAATLRDGAIRLGGDGRIRERLGDPHSWGLRLHAGRGSILFGTQQGIAGSRVAMPDPRVHALLWTSDGLWAGTEGGLALLDSNVLRAGADAVTGSGGH